VVINPFPSLLPERQAGERECFGEKGRHMSEELKEGILKYLGTVSQARNREVAKAVGTDKALVDKAITELAKEDKIEYHSFGGITYIAIKGKSET
jgi:Mn-dependent DtxR family transcriptional regulator